MSRCGVSPSSMASAGQIGSVGLRKPGEAVGRDRRPEHAEESAERDRDRGDRAGLDDEEQRPAIEEARERTQASRRKTYWPPARGYMRRELAVRERAEQRHEAGERPTRPAASAGDRPCGAMSAETMKMPDPIIDPATSIVASVSVSALTNAGLRRRLRRPAKRRSRRHGRSLYADMRGRGKGRVPGGKRRPERWFGAQLRMGRSKATQRYGHRGEALVAGARAYAEITAVPGPHWRPVAATCRDGTENPKSSSRSLRL